MYDGLDAFVNYYSHSYGDPTFVLKPESSFDEPIPIRISRPPLANPSSSSSSTTNVIINFTTASNRNNHHHDHNASRSQSSHNGELRRLANRPLHPEIRRMFIKELETTREDIFQTHLYKPRTRKGPESVMSQDAINNLLNHWPTIQNLDDFNNRLAWKSKWSSQYGELLYAKLRSLEKQRIEQTTTDDASMEVKTRKRKSLGHEMANSRDSSFDEDELVTIEIHAEGATVTPRKKIKAFAPRLQSKTKQVHEDYRPADVGEANMLGDRLGRTLSISDQASLRPSTPNNDRSSASTVPRKPGYRPIIVDRDVVQKGSRSPGNTAMRKKPIIRVIWDVVETESTPQPFRTSSDSMVPQVSKSITSLPKYDAALPDIAKRCRVSTAKLRQYFLFLQLPLHNTWRFSVSHIHENTSKFLKIYYGFALEPILSHSFADVHICHLINRPEVLFILLTGAPPRLIEVDSNDLLDAIDMLEGLDFSKSFDDVYRSLPEYKPSSYLSDRRKLWDDIASQSDYNVKS